MQFLTVLLYILLALTSLFLICLVLIQRGKGGGLAGAFGGVGGSSAFGTKAGDVFTRVTMITAGIWIALNMLLVVLSNHRSSAWANPVGQEAKSKLIPGGDPKALDAPAGKGGETVELPAKTDAAPATKAAAPRPVRPSRRSRCRHPSPPGRLRRLPPSNRPRSSREDRHHRTGPDSGARRSLSPEHPSKPRGHAPFAPQHDRIRRGSAPGRPLVRRRRGPDGEQPPPQALRPDQRPLRRPRTRARATGPRVDPPGDRPALDPGRPAQAGRGLPPQPRRPRQLPRPAPEVHGRGSGRPLRPPEPARDRRGAEGRHRRPPRGLAGPLEARRPRPWASSRRRGPTRAGRWPRNS